MPKLQTPGTNLNSELMREVPQFPRSQGGMARAGEEACDNRRERTTATAEEGSDHTILEGRHDNLG